MGTFLAYVNGGIWTWVDGELFLQEHWFSPQMAKARQRLGVPAERRFETKVRLGWKMIQRAVANVRELLRAAMPLPQLTPDDAIDLVVEHLVNRNRARNSRIKSRQHLDTS